MGYNGRVKHRVRRIDAAECQGDAQDEGNRPCCMTRVKCRVKRIDEIKRKSET